MKLIDKLPFRKKKSLSETIENMSATEKIKLVAKFRQQFRYLLNEYENNYDLSSEERKEIQKKISLILKAMNKIEQTFIDVERGLFLGIGIDLRSDDDSIIPVYLEWNKITNHIGFLGASGTGKSVAMLANLRQIIAKGWNAFVVDPKGGENQEVLSATIQFAKEFNRLDDIVYISPSYPELSSPVNIIFGMENEEIASIFKTIVDSGGGDGFYGDMAYDVTLSILTALTFLEKVSDPTGKNNKIIEKYEYIKYKRLIKDKYQKNIFTPEMQSYYQSLKEESNHLLKTMSKTEYENIIKYSRKFVTLKELTYYTNHNNLVKLNESIKNISLDKFKEDFGLYQYLLKLKIDLEVLLEPLANLDKTYYDKVTKSFITILNQLSTGEMGKIYCGTRINPLLFNLTNQDGKGLIYIMQPAPMKFNTIAEIIVKMNLKQIEVMLGNVGSSGVNLNKRLAIIIDEAGAVIYQGIENLFNKARALGATMFVYTQSFADFELKLSPAASKAIFDSINTTIRFRMNDKDSAQRVVEEISTIRKIKSMTTHSSNEEARISVTSNDEEILNVNDVLQIPVGQAIVKYNGKNLLVDFTHYGSIAYNIKTPRLSIQDTYENFSEYEKKLVDYYNRTDIEVKRSFLENKKELEELKNKRSKK